MLKNAFNKIFPFSETTTAEEREVMVLITISIFIFAICLLAAFIILPENCQLFSSNREGPFDCDGMRIRNAPPCSVCRDKGTAMAAQIFGGMAVVFLFLTPVVYSVKNRLSRSTKPPKLFD